jgi:site-specific DNA recombinase
MDEVAQTKELRLIIGRLEEFSIRVKDGLTEVDWSTQREIIRSLVKRVEIEQEKVNVVFRIAPNPSIPDLGKDCLQHCKGRETSVTSGCVGGRLTGRVYPVNQSPSLGCHPG